MSHKYVYLPDCSARKSSIISVTLFILFISSQSFRQGEIELPFTASPPPTAKLSNPGVSLRSSTGWQETQYLGHLPLPFLDH